MVSSSSTKKAARLAQKGKGKKVRFQGGTLFPMLVLAILVIGLGVIVYARATVPAADASPPTATTTGTSPTASTLCDTEGFVQLDGDLEEVDANGQPVNNDFLRTGVHSHDDGVIHWHAVHVGGGRQATPRSACSSTSTTSSSTDDSLQFPENQNGGKEYVEGETKCPDGEDGELSVTVWESPTDTSDGHRYVVRLRRHPHRQERHGVRDRLPRREAPTIGCRSRRGPPSWPQLGAVDRPDRAPPTSVPASSTPGRTDGHRRRDAGRPASAPTVIADATDATTTAAATTTTGG